MRWRAGCAVWLALLGVSAWAQMSQPGMGTVTGSVICGDTQKPARFANVILFAVPAEVTSMPKVDGTTPADGAAFRAIFKAQNSATVVQAQTRLDGMFVATGVPPGDYYALAAVPGYVQPHNVVEAAYNAGEDLTKGISGVSIVHVSADRSAQTQITATRGAAVEGRVLWDDGSPVSGVVVSVESTVKELKKLPPQFGMITGFSTFPLAPGVTDDRGHYRISGLTPGEYRVKATLPTNSHMSFFGGKVVGLTQAGTLPVLVYAPAAFHQADAKPVKLTAGEERADQDITYNLNGLHTVSGSVTSAEDHHAIATGVITLTDANDKSFRRASGLEPDGSFAVTFVPSGTYTMEVSGQDSVEENKNENGMQFFDRKVLRSYVSARQQVIVADNDVTGQNFELKPDKLGKANDAGDNGHVVGTGH